MPDARYYRGRANMTQRLADQISDAKAAAKLRETAGQYLAKADELEAEEPEDGGARPIVRSSGE
jgi:hypothetical protein